MLTSGDLANMQAYDNLLMQDTCIIGAYSSIENEYGEMENVYTDGAEIACGFDPTGGNKMYRQNMTAQVVNATVRLPLGTTVDPKSHIRITKRFGSAVTNPLVYDVVGYPQEGPSGIVLNLAEVNP
jgi:hypothetical protein